MKSSDCVPGVSWPTIRYLQCMVHCDSSFIYSMCLLRDWATIRYLQRTVHCDSSFVYSVCLLHDWPTIRYWQRTVHCDSSFIYSVCLLRDLTHEALPTTYEASWLFVYFRTLLWTRCTIMKGTLWLFIDYYVLGRGGKVRAWGACAVSYTHLTLPTRRTV